MKIRFRCRCGKLMQVESSAAGKRCQCLGCGKKVRIPVPESEVVDGELLEPEFDKSEFAGTRSSAPAMFPPSSSRLAANAPRRLQSAANHSLGAQRLGFVLLCVLGGLLFVAGFAGVAYLLANVMYSALQTVASNSNANTNSPIDVFPTESGNNQAESESSSQDASVAAEPSKTEAPIVTEEPILAPQNNGKKGAVGGAMATPPVDSGRSEYSPVTGGNRDFPGSRSAPSETPNNRSYDSTGTRGSPGIPDTSGGNASYDSQGSRGAPSVPGSIDSGATSPRSPRGINPKDLFQTIENEGCVIIFFTIEGDFDNTEISKKLATRLGTTQYGAFNRGGKAGMKFEYDGSMDYVIEVLDFVRVDLVEEKKRTIYVTVLKDQQRPRN